MLLEVNTHSLFSKWFAESGKMVKKLFDKLNAMAEDPSTLVFVLIDEVESLATARTAAASGSDPSDAIRVVNALLTQIDQIRRHTNVVIMATSNLTDCIDVAFLSRADIRQFIGPPSERARYAILKSCVDELIDKGLVTPGYDLLDIEDCSKFDRALLATFKSAAVLLQASAETNGFSGRILRRLPFLAFVFGKLQAPVSLESFMQALLVAIKRQDDQTANE
jgi:SpoVK/Ycf46/Vps4 family AAA+-type ATPase